VAAALSREIDVLEIKGRIESRAEKEMTDAQRQYLLRQQMKAIQSELGGGTARRRSCVAASRRRSCRSPSRRQRCAKSIASSG
jgi:ATP-dependent Lon protease